MPRPPARGRPSLRGSVEAARGPRRGGGGARDRPCGASGRRSAARRRSPGRAGAAGGRRGGARRGRAGVPRRRDAVAGWPANAGCSSSTRPPAGGRAARRRVPRPSSRRLGGGILAEALRRDPCGAARRILERAAWVPDLDAVARIQPLLPDGWVVVSRDGSAACRSPDDRARSGRGDRWSVARRSSDSEVELAAREAAAAERRAVAEAALAAVVTARARARASARRGVARGRGSGAPRTRPSEPPVDRRERGARGGLGRRPRRTRRDEVVRAGEALAALEPAVDRTGRDRRHGCGTGRRDDPSALATWEERAADLRVRRDRLAGQLGVTDTSRREAESTVARAVAAATYDEQRIARADADERSLTERETAMAAERDRLAVDVVGGRRPRAGRARRPRRAPRRRHGRSRAPARRGAASPARPANACAPPTIVSAPRRSPISKSRLALDAIREQVLVELAGIGAVGSRALRAGPWVRGCHCPSRVGIGRPLRRACRTAQSGEPGVDPRRRRPTSRPPSSRPILPFVLPVWEAGHRRWRPRRAGRLASLRRRFHELGAANPFAVEEYAELKDAAGVARDPGSRPARGDRPDTDPDRRAHDDDRRPVPDDIPGARDGVRRRFKQLFGGGFARLELTDPDGPGDHRRRDRGSPTGQEGPDAGDAVGRRAGADRGRPPVRDAPGSAGPVLRPRRGRRRPRRGERRPVLGGPARAGRRRPSSS